MKSYTIQLPCIELLAPDEIASNKEALKEHAWSHWKDEILRRLIVELPTREIGTGSQPSVQGSEDEKDDTTVSPTAREKDDTIVTPSIPDPDFPRLSKKASFRNGVISSPNHSLPKKIDLLNTIARVQRQFFHSESPKVIFGVMLDALLDLLDSEYGFIGEVKYKEEDGSKYLQTHAITNIAWDNVTRQFYDDNIGNGLSFLNLHSLFGSVITTEAPVISNTPKTDQRRGGLPVGHPPLDHFLGIPFFMPGGEMNGMVGISNKPGGYNKDDIEFLEPFTVTCGNLIKAFNQIKENKYLINTLEDSVKKRTGELEQANVELAEANRFVLKANKLQLQQFACMSHEIRTPLNCVIGMSSVLKESRLSPMQEEAVEMIVSSGDLLLAIINDILDYSKLETENVNINVQRSNLQDTIALVLNSIKSKALRTQSIQSHFDATIPEQVHTDCRRLQQILFNLLGNAIKFSPSDGIIKLSIEMISLPSNEDGDVFTSTKDENPSFRSSVGNLSLNSLPENEICNLSNVADIAKSDDEIRMLRFIVEDNGKGIDENDLKRIFQPFRQASATAENIYGGTGLGLSITQKIVTALGGIVSVESQKGEWSKFTVDIPCPESPVILQEISQQVETYVVHVVGFGDAEKSMASGLLQTFNMDGSYFPSLDDMLDNYQTGTLRPEQVHVCFVHEDCFDDNLLPRLSQSIIVTVGPKFSVDEDKIASHFRSLEHILPSYFINHVVRLVSNKRQQTESTNTVVSAEYAAKSYTEMKVLIAEDNVVNQKVFSRILNRLNIKNIDIVGNGLDACKKEEEVVYDIIFMDHQMPIMGGVEACRQIINRHTVSQQQQQQQLRPTIIFVTAHVATDFEVECMDAGGSGFISKPFNLEIIEECVQTVYKQRLKNERGRDKV